MLYLALFAVTGRTRIAVPAASCILYVISLAETFVVAFRGRPIMLWDVMAFRTAMTVSGNYEFFITRQMKAAFVLLLLMNVFLWFIPRRVKGWKLRLAVGGGITASIAAYGAWFFAVLVPSLGAGHQYVGHQRDIPGIRLCAVHRCLPAVCGKEAASGVQ
ncbi:MAG: hypothetical protein ACLTW9_07125 [Enterocloster sp.]